MKIARELRYRPNYKPQGDGYVLGLVMPELSDGFYSSVLAAVDAEAQQHGHKLLALSYQCDAGKLGEILSYLQVLAVDGVILVAPQEEVALWPLVDKCPMPIFGINTAKSCACTSFLRVDNAQGSMAMTEHFIKIHSCKRIAIVRGPALNIDAEERFCGFKRALEVNGLELDPSLVVDGDFRSRSGYYAFSRLMSLPKPPEAIFCCNDMMAIGAYDAAKSLQIKIGEDVRVGGFDDIPSAALLSPGLTSVHVPSDEIGAKAVRGLVSHLVKGAAKKGSSFETISSGLMVRSSCGCRIQ